MRGIRQYLRRAKQVFMILYNNHNYSMEKPILTAQWCHTSGLWKMPLEPSAKSQNNNNWTYSRYLAEHGTRITIEGEDEPPAGVPPTKCNDFFFAIVDMAEMIHSDDIGPFPYILQKGKQILMIAIHVNANYIFAKTIRNKTEGERIHAYQNKSSIKWGMPS